MGQILVRNLRDDVIAIFKQKAELNGHSLEQEVRDALTAAAKLSREQFIAVADRIRAMTPNAPQTDSTLLIREDRDNNDPRR